MKLMALGLLAVGLWAQTPAPGPQGAGGGAPTGPCGGDLGGTEPNCTVISIGGKQISHIATEIDVTKAPYLASGSNVTTTTSGTFGVGTSGTIASCTSFITSEGVYIAGAGAASANYVGTIVSCASGALVVTPATSTSVANGALVQHDETAAFTSAINAAALASVKIYVPDGFYRINGPPTGGSNSILQIPSIALPNPAGTAVPVTIEIDGQTIPPTSPYQGVNQSGAIIQTSGTSGNLIAGYNASSSFSNFTFVNLVLRNLTFRTYANPSITVINGTGIAEMSVHDVMFDVGITGTPTQPLNTNGRGLVMSGIFNWLTSIADNVQVSGYYDGITAGDHSSFGFISSVFNTRAFVDLTSDGVTTVKHITLQDSTYGIVPVVSPLGNSTSPIVIDALDYQDIYVTPSGWSTGTIGIIYDPSNLAVGRIAVYNNSNTLPVVGGANVLIANISKLGPYQSINISPPLGGFAGWYPFYLPGNIANTGQPIISQAGQQLTFTAISGIGGGNVGYQSKAFPNFTGKTFTGKVTGITDNQFCMFVGLPVNSNIRMSVYLGNLIMQVGGGGILGSTPYSPTTHLWWRIRESSGTWFAETSTDGITWAQPAAGFSTTVGYSYTSGVNVGFFTNTSSTGYAEISRISVN